MIAGSNRGDRISLLSDYLKIRGAYENRQRNIKKRKERVTIVMLVSLGSLFFFPFFSPLHVVFYKPVQLEMNCSFIASVLVIINSYCLKSAHLIFYG